MVSRIVALDARRQYSLRQRPPRRRFRKRNRYVKLLFLRIYESRKSAIWRDIELPIPKMYVIYLRLYRVISARCRNARIDPSDRRPLAALACSKLILYCVTITVTHTAATAIASRIGSYIALYLGHAKLLRLSRFRVNRQWAIRDPFAYHSESVVE